MILPGPPLNERRRYRSPQQDSARWDDFPLRDGDIVISAPAKSGTTWVQMMCALLVFQKPELPQPLSTLSPWLDQVYVPQEELYAKLAAQEHRRVIKTHVPLDGLPLDPRVSYIVVARHPLDRALSMYHQAANIHGEWLRAFQTEPDEQSSQRPAPTLPPVREWLLNWCTPGASDEENRGIAAAELHHPLDAWNRRAEPNVRLMHYDDLATDLEGQMRSLADWLGIPLDEAKRRELVKAATFDEMKARADWVAPDKQVLVNPSDFFHGGRSGAGRDALTEEDLESYRKRVSAMAPQPFLDRLNR